MRHTFLYAPTSENSGGSAKKLHGQLSEAEINQLKGKHKLGIYSIKVGGHIGYFREPDIDDLNSMYAAEDNHAIMEMWLVLGEGTFIGGSKELLTNAILFRSTQKRLMEKVRGEESEMVNL